MGSALGLALGAALATVSLQWLGGDLGSGFFSFFQPEVAYSAASVAAFFALGLAASVGGSWLPARDAARTSPALAMKAGAEEDAHKPLGRACWLAMLGLRQCRRVCRFTEFGVRLARLRGLIGPSHADRIARSVFAAAHTLEDRRRRRAGAWVTRIAQAPSFAAIGMAGIVASFALMIAMATMVASFRDSVDDWLTRILPAQLYVRAAPGASTAFFSAADIESIRSHPAVERVDFSRASIAARSAARQVTCSAAIDVANPCARCR